MISAYVVSEQRQKILCVSVSSMFCVSSVGAPSFELNPVTPTLLGAKNGRVVIECKPKAAPRPTFSWSRGTELLSNSSR